MDLTILVAGTAMPVPDPGWPVGICDARGGEPALLGALRTALAGGHRRVAVVPLDHGAAVRRLRLASSLRTAGRRFPFIDLHLAAPPSDDERADLMATVLRRTGRTGISDPDLPGAAALAWLIQARHPDLAVRAEPDGAPAAAMWSQPEGLRILGRLRDEAFAAPVLAAEAWQEVLCEIAGGGHHGPGRPSEAVSAAGTLVVRRSAGGASAPQPAPSPPPADIRPDLAADGPSPLASTGVAPVAASEAIADPEAQAVVLARLSRGIRLLTQLPVIASPVPGWVGVACRDRAMAAWMLRAVAAQDIAARRDGAVLWMPAGPRFAPRIEERSILLALTRAFCTWLAINAPPAPDTGGAASQM